MKRNWTREERARRELLVRVGLAGIALLAVGIALLLMG